MIGKVATKAVRIARGTALAMGVAVMLALVVGVSTTALAGTGVGARFDLGKVNTVSAITKLVGSVAGPSLQIDNNSTGAGATALDLQVESGKAPMKVNSATKVTNLNSDKIDNLDSSAFLPSNGKAADADELDGKDSSEFASAAMFGSAVGTGAASNLGPDCTLGEVRLFAGSQMPRNWTPAHGQLLPISQNQTLFSLLQTNYGGDGQTTFALPDLRGAEPKGAGAAAPSYAICVQGVFPN